MLPTQQLLEKVRRKIMSVPNRKRESKRGIHYGLFLLGYKAGLRVSEAVKFDLASKAKRGLYRIERPKGKKERLVYIPKKVIRELRKNNWRPNQTNRFNFYHFLKKIKRELNISANIELAPHTLRHAFATYHAENGLSLPILSKILGHVSVRTTALYWKNIYQEPDNEVGPILAGKKWLENKERPKPPPITENFPEVPKVPKPIFIERSPVILHKEPAGENNSLSTTKTIKKTPGMLISEISLNSQESFLLNSPSKKSDQLKTTQPLPLIANNEKKPTKRELILLQKIKQLESSLETSQNKLTEALQSKSELKEKLTEIHKENNNLKAKNQHLKQLLQQEKQRANNYRQQLKSIVRVLKQ